MASFNKFGAFVGNLGLAVCNLNTDTLKVYLSNAAPDAAADDVKTDLADLTRIRASRHYRPGEHLYYWTEPGFVAWMAGRRFRCFDRRDFETAAGRDSIRTFAFRKGLA